MSLPQAVILTKWHDVRITQRGENITLLLDGNLDLQEVVTLPALLRTTSLLYIGGLPSKCMVIRNISFI